MTFLPTSIINLIYDFKLQLCLHHVHLELKLCWIQKQIKLIDNKIENLVAGERCYLRKSQQIKKQLDDLEKINDQYNLEVESYKR